MNSSRNSSQKKKEELSAAEALTSLCKSPATSPLCSSITQTIPPQQEHEGSSPFLLPSPACGENNISMPPLASTSNIQLHDASPVNKKSEQQTKLSFPQKLFDILENPEHADILKWLPGGKAFIIMDKKRFATEILPVYFKQTQFTSFTRKLSRWKFARVPRGPYLGAYYHKLFRRDHKALCRLMSCNNEMPSLAVIAQVRQEAMESAAASSQNVVVPSINLSLPQQSALQNLEEMNKIAMLKEQLLQIRLQRAQLYERQKRILMGYGCESFPKNPDATNHLQPLPTHLLASAYNCSNQNQFLNQQNISLTQMAKLRQMEILNAALSTNGAAQLQRYSMMPPQNQGAGSAGDFTAQSRNNGWAGNKNCFRASAA